MKHAFMGVEKMFEIVAERNKKTILHPPPFLPKGGKSWLGLVSEVSFSNELTILCSLAMDTRVLKGGSSESKKNY